MPCNYIFIDVGQIYLKIGIKMFDYNKTIILATQNKGKIKELKEPLAKLGYEIIGLDSMEIFNGFDVEENGKSFVENALIKAKAVANLCGLIAIADDSGLEVEALNNEPGIYSARYALDMPSLTGKTQDERNIQKLLISMQDKENRKARFCCAMCAYDPKNDSHIYHEGYWNGEILTQMQGENGFGYDPVFFAPEFNLSAAEVSKEVKMQYSHRSKAISGLITAWADWRNSL